jgi:pimeloyl-ACP methyl ester carboxylesterase
MSHSPTEQVVAVNGNSFYYRDWGGSGQAVVLLHGLASNCRIWDLVAPILSRQLWTLALDQRGHGRSFKPDTGYDFATVVSDLDGFMSAVGIENPVLVGHSWGGDVALEYAVANPGKVKGLCFVDGGTIEISARPNWTLEDAKGEMAPPVWKGVTLEAFRARLRSRSIAMDDDRVEQIVLANFRTLDDGTITSRLSRDNHFKIIEALWDHKPSELYPRVECPVLLMPARQRNGEPSPTRRFWREQAIARAESLLPRSKTVWMEDSIHDVPLQRPSLVASTIADHIVGGYLS